MTPWAVLTRLLCPWNSPGKNTAVGCHFLLQGALLNPGIGPRSPALQVVSLIAGGFFTDWATHSQESLTKETRSRSRHLSREIQVRLRKSRPPKSKQTKSKTKLSQEGGWRVIGIRDERRFTRYRDVRGSWVRPRTEAWENVTLFIWQAMPWEQEQMGQRSWDRLDKTKMTGHPFSDIHAAFWIFSWVWNGINCRFSKPKE